MNETTTQAAPESAPESPLRCGRIAIVGRPNVGKSTLLNALVGQKISITSRKAQTTRHRITGIRTEGEAQYVFVDTPGFQTRHSGALNRSLNKTVQGTLQDVDVVFFVLEAGYYSAQDEQVLGLLPKNIPVFMLANKLDTTKDKSQLPKWFKEQQKRFDFAQMLPLSAKNPKDMAHLLSVAKAYLPEQAWWYGEDELTDKNERFLATEIVREKLFRLTGDELPYASTVIIDKFEEDPKTGMRTIAASIVVEREIHKGMVIGQGGDRLKRIGTEARQELEKLMDCKVFLELWVKVRSGWADDEAHLRSYGYGQ